MFFKGLKISPVPSRHRVTTTRKLSGSLQAVRHPAGRFHFRSGGFRTRHLPRNPILHRPLGPPAALPDLNGGREPGVRVLFRHEGIDARTAEADQLFHVRTLQKPIIRCWVHFLSPFCKASEGTRTLQKVICQQFSPGKIVLTE